MPAIELDALHFHYPPPLPDGEPVSVLQGVSFSVPPGQSVAITGATGSGKTTLALLLAGLAPAMTGGTAVGRAQIGGWDALSTPPARLSQTVGIVFQEPERQLFNMTVAEEIAFGLEGRALPPAEIGARVAQVVQQIGLAGHESRAPWQLSGGQQKRLAIGCIIAMQPAVMVLDEPMAGLDPVGRREVAALLAELSASTGATVIVLEKDAEFIARWAERVLVLDEGRIVHDGSPAAIYRAVADLHRRGVAVPQMAELAHALRARGEDAAFLTAREAAQWMAVRQPTWRVAPAVTPAAGSGAQQPVMVAADDLSFSYEGRTLALDHLTLHAPRGQFIAIAGPNGGGKSTLARHLIGLLRPQGGALQIEGRPTAGKAVAELARSVGYVFQNPDYQIFAPTVREEISVGPRAAGLRGAALAERLDAALAAFDLAAYAELPPAVLGYGVRRLVTLASVWAMQPPVWLLDEPTTGLDARLTARLMQRLHDLHAAGRTILLITHDLRLAAEAERLVVISGGRVVQDGAPAQVFQDAGALAAVGLRPPAVTRLALKLAPAGFPRLALSVEEFVDNYELPDSQQGQVA